MRKEIDVLKWSNESEILKKELEIKKREVDSMKTLNEKLII